MRELNIVEIKQTSGGFGVVEGFIELMSDPGALVFVAVGLIGVYAISYSMNPAHKRK